MREIEYLPEGLRSNITVEEIMQGAVLGEGFVSEELEICYYFESDNFKGTCSEGLPHGEVRGKEEGLYHFYKGKEAVFKALPLNLEALLLFTNLSNIEQNKKVLDEYIELTTQIRVRRE